MDPPHNTVNAEDLPRLKGTLRKWWAQRVFDAAVQLPEIHGRTLKFLHKSSATTWLVSKLTGKVVLEGFRGQTSYQALSSLIADPRDGVFVRLVSEGHVRLERSAASATEAYAPYQGVASGPVVKLEEQTDGGPVDLNEGISQGINSEWKMRLYDSVAVPEAEQPLWFPTRKDAQRYLMDTVSAKYRIPVLYTYDMIKVWDHVCRSALDSLKHDGQITWPTTNGLEDPQSNQLPSAAVSRPSTQERLRTQDFRTHGQDTITAETHHPASWEAGFQRGHTVGFAAGLEAAREAGRLAGQEAGREAGRAAALAAAAELLHNEQLATKDPVQVLKRQAREHMMPRERRNTCSSSTGGQPLVTTPAPFGSPAPFCNTAPEPRLPATRSGCFPRFGSEDTPLSQSPSFQSHQPHSTSLGAKSREFGEEISEPSLQQAGGFSSYRSMKRSFGDVEDRPSMGDAGVGGKPKLASKRRMSEGSLESGDPGVSMKARGSGD